MAKQSPAKTSPTRRKAAILLASMDRELAARIMQELSAEALRMVAIELRMLGEITPEMQEKVFEEFSNQLDYDTKVRGGEDVARRLLVEVVGEKRAEEILASWGDERPFSGLCEADPVDLAQILDKEQPAVAAMVLAHLPPHKMAEVLEHFEPELGQQVVTRLACQSQDTDSKVVEQIEKVLLSRVLSVGHRDKTRDKLSGPKRVADMLQHLERSREQELLAAIQSVSSERAEEVRELMFTFEDLTKLPDDAIQLVLRQVTVDKLALSLRGAPHPVLEKITRNLSSNARQNLQEEIELMGKVKLSEVEAEQRKIVAIVRELEESGEINYRGGIEEEVYV
jgi:flagellar motor switch protein FliG